MYSKQIHIQIYAEASERPNNRLNLIDFVFHFDVAIALTVSNYNGKWWVGQTFVRVAMPLAYRVVYAAIQIQTLEKMI